MSKNPFGYGRSEFEGIVGCPGVSEARVVRAGESPSARRDAEAPGLSPGDTNGSASGSQVHGALRRAASMRGLAGLFTASR